MRPLYESDRAFPERSSTRLSTVLNGRHIDAERGPQPLAYPEEPLARWRRFVRLLNHRGESLRDE